MMTSDELRERLIAANDILRTVIDENPNIILMKDWDGRFLIGNRALANLYGTTPDELVGKDDGAFNPNQEQVAFYLQNVRDIMLNGETQIVMEESTDVATGETRYYQSIKKPLLTKDGKRQILVIANDVTDLKHTQQKLEASEHRLNYVLDATREGLWDWDIASGNVSHNLEWCRIVGLDDGYLNHPLEHFAALLHEDDKPLVMARINACLERGEPYQSEHRMRMPNGQVAWVLDRGDVVERDAAGMAVRMVGSFLNIDERKAAEMALEVRESYLRATLDNFPFLIWLKDKDSRFMVVNHEFASAAGKAHPAELVGLTDLDVWPSELAEAYRADDFAVMKSKLDKSTEELLEVAGKRIHIETYKHPVITADGEVIGTVGFARDITERYESEARLQDRNEQLNTIFSLSPDGLLVFDQDQRVRFANEAFFRITQLSEEDVDTLNEMTFRDLMLSLCTVKTRFPSLAEMEKRALLADGDKQSVILHLIRGSRIVEVFIKSSNAASVSKIWYFRDITHEWEVAQMKSEFLSTAAHELRTPMASVYGYAELLNHREFDAEQQKEMLSVILDQSQMVNSIINELLDLSRIEARRGKDFIYEKFNLCKLLQSIVEHVGVQCPHRLQLTLLPQSATLRADRKKITQAVNNVLSNALKYSDATQLVEVTLDAGVMDGVGFLVIKVVDRGIGMTADESAKIFDRFYRADKSGKVPGTGLGMSIVKEIIELHLGKVMVSSEFGKGTTVELWLPDY